MALTRFELYFAFQIYISCREQSLVQIGIDGSDRKLQFRMIRNDLVRRLSLLNKRGYELVLFTKLTFGEIDSGSGVGKCFAVFTIRKPGVISVLMSNRTVIDLLWASIADIGGLIQSTAALLLKILTGLIAGWTGCTFHTAKDDLPTGIGLLTVVTMNTEVLRIIKGAFVIPVRHAMSLNLF